LEVLEWRSGSAPLLGLAPAPRSLPNLDAIRKQKILLDNWRSGPESVGVEMSFLKAVKAKIGETKQGISDMNDRRKVSDLLDTMASFPLCSESDAFHIVEGLLTKYIGRSIVATIDLDTASPEEFTKEMAALDIVDEKLKVFLNIIAEEKFKEKVKMLRGSI
jgi:hypothetical protein